MHKCLIVINLSECSCVYLEIKRVTNGSKSNLLHPETFSLKQMLYFLETLSTTNGPAMSRKTT